VAEHALIGASRLISPSMGVCGVRRCGPPTMQPFALAHPSTRLWHRRAEQSWHLGGPAPARERRSPGGARRIRPPGNCGVVSYQDIRQGTDEYRRRIIFSALRCYGVAKKSTHGGAARWAVSCTPRASSLRSTAKTSAELIVEIGRSFSDVARSCRIHRVLPIVWGHAPLVAFGGISLTTTKGVPRPIPPSVLDVQNHSCTAIDVELAFSKQAGEA
jgi:hypothetical protein